MGIGLLRLSNNDIDRSLELYNSIGVEKVLERAERLDAKREKKHRASDKKKHGVRDIDLVSLVSMGVNAARAREALEATGNSESALLWMSQDEARSEEANDEENRKDVQDSLESPWKSESVNAQ